MDKLWRAKLRHPPPRVEVLYEEVPVAELTYDPATSEYVFRYLEEFGRKGLAALPELPFGQEHRKKELFRFFKERIPDLLRPEVAEWLKHRALDRENVMNLLTSLGSRSVTDSFQLRKAA